jgi:hypothetical protein
VTEAVRELKGYSVIAKRAIPRVQERRHLLPVLSRPTSTTLEGHVFLTWAASRYHEGEPGLRKSRSSWIQTVRYSLQLGLVSKRVLTN